MKILDSIIDRIADRVLDRLTDTDESHAPDPIHNPVADAQLYDDDRFTEFERSIMRKRAQGNG